MTPQSLSIADLKAVKIRTVQESKEITDAVKLLIALFRDCELNTYIRMEWSLPDTKESFELTFLKLNSADATHLPTTEPKIEEK